MLISQHARRDVSDRSREERLGRLRVRQQRLDLLAQRVVASTRCGHERGALARIAVERGVAHLFNTPPTLGIRHRSLPFTRLWPPNSRLSLRISHMTYLKVRMSLSINPSLRQQRCPVDEERERH